jgi:hypothetical protein
MTEIELKLHTALLGTGVVQPHQSYTKSGRVEILCRQVPGQSAAVIEMLTALLKKAQEENVTIHACKRFVLKDGVLVFGWNFAIETKNAKELKVALDKLIPALEQVRPALVAVHEEAPAPRPVAAAPAAPEEEMEEEDAPPPPPRKSDYKTDAQVARNLGITVDAKAGKLGRLEPQNGGRVHYEVGKRLPGHRISVLSAGVDDAGRPVVISEMPLPHVRKEMNVPKFEGDKGATYVGKTKIGRATQSRR